LEIFWLRVLRADLSQALDRELKERGHFVEREVSVRISYKGSVIGIQRLDMTIAADGCLPSIPEIPRMRIKKLGCLTEP
jgi:hypothetical protein